MGSAEIVRELVRRGHSVSVDGADLVIYPPMGEALTKRVRARKADVVAYLRELGAPAASGHRFVALTTADLESVRDGGVCIACETRWRFHGEPSIADWFLVDEPNDVALLHAAAIVIMVAATEAVALAAREFGEAP